MLNKIKVDILNYLIKNEKVSFDDISFHLNIKNRMIYNYIDEINFILEKNKINKIKIKKGILESKLTNIDLDKLVLNSTYLFSLEERIIFLCFDIILFKNKNDIENYADILNVSKNTIINDFKKIKKILDSYSLILKFDHSLKYEIIGDELRKREFLISIIVDFICIYNNIFVEKLLNINSYINKNIKLELNKINNEIGKKLSNNYLIFLEYYLSMLLIYYKKKNFILIDDIDKNVLSKSVEYKHANKLLSKIMFDGNLPSDEIYYLTILLTSGNVVNEYNHFIEDSNELKKCINQFLLTIELNTYLFFVDKSNLIKDIYNHLIPAYYRIKFNLDVSKGYVDLVKKKYKRFFDITKNNIYVIEDFLKIKFNENEIAFITLYLASSIISNSNSIDKIKTIIVTNEGINIYRILKIELEKIFINLDIVKIVDYDVFVNEKEKYDLVLSSIDLDYKDYIKINNILNEHDKKNIDKKIKIILSEKEKSILHLSSIFFERHINIFRDYKFDWKEAIKHSSNILLKENKISQKYIDQMITNILENKAVVVLGDKIAMPHATSKDGVNEIAFSFNVFKNEIVFPNKNKSKINIIIILAPIDSEKHITPMLELINVLQEKSNIKKIMNSCSKKEIYNILVKK